MHKCMCASACLYGQAVLLRSLSDAVLRHIDQHRLHVTDVNSLSSCEALRQLAAKATVIEL